MAKCFSFTASRDWCYRYTFASAGLKSITTDIGDGTTIHCWVPKTHKPEKQALLLIHGFGANAMWQWSELLRPFITRFNIYVPDLIFFGDSCTTRLDRSDLFQAQCVMRFMETRGVRKFSLIGLSYGGFVGYSLAAQFKDVVEHVVICCAGVCLEEKDLSEGLFVVATLEEATNILVPQTPEKLKVLMQMSFAKPAKNVPSCFLRDFIDVNYVQEKRELIQAILKDRKLSEIPRITQPTLIIWGEQDQVFPVELGHRLKSHVGENAELVVIKNAGHGVNMEKPKEFYKYLKTFLLDSLPHTSPSKNHDTKID
ncbi:hypothetical protein IFM89_008551 [Coptis chinensis]|uniref:AB hydrolase-1 domain-containing protein n=1 Tax=Coptis chinensis TaxID=261450 RepID=A0A835HYY5_9MAGN|nr:hypothetical protein IFM89_008551 [Coptis chinensis]